MIIRIRHNSLSFWPAQKRGLPDLNRLNEKTPRHKTRGRFSDVQNQSTISLPVTMHRVSLAMTDSSSVGMTQIFTLLSSVEMTHS